MYTTIDNMRCLASIICIQRHMILVKQSATTDLLTHRPEMIDYPSTIMPIAG